MRLLTKFDIKRWSDGEYVVTANGEPLAEFTTYKQAEDFVFNSVSKELVQDYAESDLKIAA